MNERAKASESTPWAPFEDRRRARDEKRSAVLRMAVRLFLESGYHRATLNDVASRLNITKPALYNYFRSKEEILEECYRLGQELIAESIKIIDREGGDGLIRLRKLIRAYALNITNEFGMCVVRLDDRELSDEAHAKVRKAKRKVDLVLRKYITEGIADGSIMKCDPKLTSFAIAGSLNWIGYWYQPDGRFTPDIIAEEFTLRLTDGLATRRSGRPAGKEAQSNPGGATLPKKAKRGVKIDGEM